MVEEENVAVDDIPDEESTEKKATIDKPDFKSILPREVQSRKKRRVYK